MTDPQEPPPAPSSIPFVGHVAGLMRNKFNYYVQLRERVRAPIFTVTMPGQKMYIVTTPELVQSVQKQPKVLAFPPIEAKFATNVCDITKETQEILAKNVNGEDGDWGLSMDSYSEMRAALSPGVGLDQMNRVMIKELAAGLDDLLPKSQSMTRVNLVEWLRRAVTLATTNSVYGPDNPFKKDEVFQGFWAFESELMAIVIGIMPSIVARKGVAGRQKVSKAFETYLKNGGHRRGSVLMQNRYHAAAKNGVSVEDIARFEVGGSIAVLVNTTPASFWMLFFVNFHPGLLDEIREEIAKIMTSNTPTGDKGITTRSLDITGLKTQCPLLTSTFQEVLRYRSMGTSVREVMEDTTLEGQWLLKKGAMVQMPSRIMHQDSTIWGEDADELKPRRFLKDEASKTGALRRARAFRAFGGGSTLCPGRHFATNEVLAVVAMFIMKFDMRPLEGEWRVPTTENTNVAAVLMEPDTDIPVEISHRKGFEGDEWSFDLADSTHVFAVAAEDKE
ncbi:MAG: hypothetical protein M1828_007187 [Chrysothrix sp. TS-e1954]|nr:MAG: hypothetical protein M1828_007187 [Chrysothrix sp. TS-e1954]